MRKRTIELILVAVLVGALTALSNTETVWATNTIYIRPDGSVYPPEAGELLQRSGDLYTFTANIYESIVVQKDNLMIDGNNHLLSGSGSDFGFYVANRVNVTIKNSHVAYFKYGIGLNESESNIITQNYLEKNTWAGILVSNSSSNTVSRNTVFNNTYHGIHLWGLDTQTNIITGNNVSNNGGIEGGDGISIGMRASYNTIINNTVSGNSGAGIALGWEWSTGNIIAGNNITFNEWTGIYMAWETESDNQFYHNNIDNNFQVNNVDAVNTWDNGYLSGGNYWSDYTGVDLYSGPNQDQPGSDTIGDTPYVIDANNQDQYPLMTRWPMSPDIAVTKLSKTTAGSGYNTRIYVTVFNKGSFSEHVSLTLYINGENFATQTFDSTEKGSTTITFQWNTAGSAKGNYTISAYAAPVPGETYIGDNTRSDGWVFVTIPGDINGDRKINVIDATLLSVNFGRPDLNPSCDINGDGYVNVIDALITMAHWGEHW